MAPTEFGCRPKKHRNRNMYCVHEHRFKGIIKIKEKITSKTKILCINRVTFFVYLFKGSLSPSFTTVRASMHMHALICLVKSAAGSGISNVYAHTYLSPLMRPTVWSHKHYSTPGNECGCVYVCREGACTVEECVYVWFTNGTGQTSSISCSFGDT